MTILRAIDLDYVRERTWWLVPVVFAGVTAVVAYKYVLYPTLLGLDASLYASAAGAWVSGGDPWLTSQNGIFYAAPPPSLLPYLPFIWMPPGLTSLIWVSGSAVLAYLSIKTLRLPTWWLLFPPLIDGILVGNGNVAVLGLLVLGSSRSAPIAVFIKVYAIVPLVGERRWRLVLVSIVGVLATVAVLPWSLWLSKLETITANLERTSASTSVYGQPVWMIVAAVALVSLGWRRAGWLAVPLLWPHTQPHYAAMSIPGLTPYLAMAWCIPIPEVWVTATVALAITERFAARQTGIDPEHPPPE